MEVTTVFFFFLFWTSLLCYLNRQLLAVGAWCSDGSMCTKITRIQKKTHTHTHTYIYIYRLVVENGKWEDEEGDRRYSVYLLYDYKSTNTDAEGAADILLPSFCRGKLTSRLTFLRRGLSCIRWESDNSSKQNSSLSGKRTFTRDERARDERARVRARVRASE
jgi:hypothetical protein